MQVVTAAVGEEEIEDMHICVIPAHLLPRLLSSTSYFRLQSSESYSASQLPTNHLLEDTCAHTLHIRTAIVTVSQPARPEMRFTLN